MNTLEEKCLLLHRFFCAGGQIFLQEPEVCIYLPVEWDYDPATCEQVKDFALPLINSGQPFHAWTVAEAAQHLQITYRKAIELTAKFYFGGYKKSGVFHVYPPSVIAYLHELTQSMRRRRWYDTKLNG